MRRLFRVAALLAASLTGAATAQGRVVYELHPAGPSHGTVVMIHGGGWALVGDQAAESVRTDALHYADDGYSVYVPTYPASNADITSLGRDVAHIAAHPPSRPICVAGDSAGGHLALMLAIRYPRLVRCVISRAGITDPGTLASINPGLADFACQLWCAQPGGLDAVSPLHLHRKLRARDVLLTVAICDAVVGADQSRALASALPGSKLYIYPCAPGPTLVHASISGRNDRLENLREARFLASRMNRAG
jgi:pimeloyl-ACP methyl ester carboxylesterase